MASRQAGGGDLPAKGTRIRVPQTIYNPTAHGEGVSLYLTLLWISNCVFNVIGSADFPQVCHMVPRTKFRAVDTDAGLGAVGDL